MLDKAIKDHKERGIYLERLQERLNATKKDLGI
jgi:hypothetical protein